MSLTNQQIELEALKTEREGMLAENWELARCGARGIYDEKSFNHLAERIRALKQPEAKCKCTFEAGDSPCPIHGETEQSEAPAPKPQPVITPLFEKAIEDACDCLIGSGYDLTAGRLKSELAKAEGETNDR